MYSAGDFSAYCCICKLIQNKDKACGSASQALSFPEKLSESLVFIKTLLVKGRVEGVKILAVELICQQTQILAEALIVHDLARPEKAYRVDDIRVVAEPQDVVVGRSSLLFGGVIKALRNVI